jgi:hypothetical protein
VVKTYPRTLVIKVIDWMNFSNSVFFPAHSRDATGGFGGESDRCTDTPVVRRRAVFDANWYKVGEAMQKKKNGDIAGWDPFFTRISCYLSGSNSIQTYKDAGWDPYCLFRDFALTSGITEKDTGKFSLVQGVIHQGCSGNLNENCSATCRFFVCV